MSNRFIGVFLLAIAMFPGVARSQDPLLAPFVTPSVSLNNPTLLAGKTPGEFDAGNDGSASYRIPLVLPPGTGGAVPRLAIAYSSKGGNGLVGVGWMLAGLSSITRCPTHLVPDGSIDAVDFDASDRFCLDGQTLVPFGDGTYRTEIDSFSRVSWSGGTAANPTKWTVYTKDGKILEFGGTTDSRIEAQGRTDILVWTLNRSQDRAGNFYTITYGKVSSYGFFAPVRMDYTGNTAAGLTPSNSVLLHYETRTDASDAYVGGTKTSVPVRLKQIEILSGTTRVRVYDLSYQNGTATGRSRLTQVRECGFSGSTPACLPITALAWQEGTPSFAPSTNWLAGTTAGTNSVTDANDRQFVVDVNGDGRADYVWAKNGNLTVALSSGSGFAAGATWLQANTGGLDVLPDLPVNMYFQDLSGDGLNDYIWISGNAVYWAKSTGSAFANPVLLLAANSGPAGIPVVNGGKNFVADLNGDGRADYLWGYNGIHVALSTGTGLATPTTWLPDKGGPGGIDVVAVNAVDMLFPDLNGDGQSDYMWLSINGNWSAALSTGTGFEAPTSVLPSSAGPGGVPVHNAGKQFVVDLNGDGCSDYLWIYNAIHAALSNCRTLLAPSTVLAQNGGPNGISTNPADDSNLHLADFNGDGRTDYMWMMNNAWHVALSTGQGFASPPATWITANTGPGSSAVFNPSDQFAADVDGDGRSDHIWFSGPGWNAARKTDPYPDFLSQLTDGFGAPMNLDYLPLTDASVYQKGTGAVYPVMEQQRGSYVLADAKMPNGLGGQTTRSFFYKQLRAEARRGLDLGFASVDELDQARGTLTTTFYNQVFPIQGTQNKLELRAAGVVRMRTTSTVSSSGGPIYRSFASQNMDEFFEANAALTVRRTTTQQVDSFNNPTVMTSTASDGYGKTTTTTYTNDQTNWLLGLATSVQIVASAPGVPNLTRTVSNQYSATTGLRTQEVLQPSTPLALTRNFTRDAFGNIKKTDTLGSNITTRSESVTFDSKGLFPITTTNALNQALNQTFDARFGVPLTVTTPDPLTTTMTYDPLGRELSRTNPDGTVETQVIASCASAALPCPSIGVISVGKLRTGTPPQYLVSDVLGREVRKSTQGFSGTTIHLDTEYDAMGRVARTSLPYFSGVTPSWVQFTYDALDRRLTRTDPDGSVTAYGYSGLTTVVTNALTQPRTEIKNSQDKLLQVKDAANKSTLYLYDAFDNVLSATDAQARVVSATYDVLGRKLTLSDPDLGMTVYTYDVLGEMLKQTDAKGQVRSFTYDLAGRLKQRTEADGQATFTYDTAVKGVGELASVSGTTSGNAFSRSFAFDSFGRPSSATVVVDGRTYTTTTQYDSSGRVSGLVYPDGFAARNVYNTAGYLSRVENASTSAVYWTEEAQNAAGQLVQELFGNGLRTQRTFDPLTLRLTQIRNGPGTGSGTQNLTYAWDAIGVLRQRADVNRSLAENFQYDALSRLTQAQVVGQSAVVFSYDAVGNMLSKSDVGTYTYGSSAHAHAVTATSGAVTRSYTYDANGNQLERFNGSGMSIGQFVYTSFDKPSFINASVPAGVNVSQFRYDDARNLLVRTDSPAGGSASTTYYASGGLYEEVLFGGGVTEQRHYIRGRDAVVALYTTKTATPPAVRYLHREHLGSVDVVTDASGGVLESLSYDAFGKRRNANWTAAATPIVSGLTKGFTGHVQLDDLGLVHMGGRVYDPSLGRFTSADPFVQYPDDTQGFNRYTYVNNSPLTFVDGSGFGFFKSLGRAIQNAVGTIFSNPLKFIANAALVVAGCIFTGPGCAALLTWAGAAAAAIKVGIGVGLEIASAAARELVYGNDPPGFLRTSDRIAGALAALGPPMRTIVGIGGGEIRLPFLLEQWTQSKTGSVILNVDDDKSQGERPSYDEMAQYYPNYGVAIVGALIGGVIGERIEKKEYEDACTIRVCRALNKSGVEIPIIKHETAPGADGSQYIFRVATLKSFLTSKFGRPDVVSRKRSAFEGKKGIIIFEKTKHHEGADHADLWDGTTCLRLCFFEGAGRVQLWRLPD